MRSGVQVGDAPKDEDAEIIASAVRLLLDGRDSEAQVELLRLPELDPIEPPTVYSTVVTTRKVHSSRPSTNPSLLAPILRRDGWRCQYCGRKLVVSGVIVLVATLCPEQFLFPPGHHMPVIGTHPAAVRVYPNVDHLLAGSSGGDWRDQANLVAACTPCNERKSDKLGWVTLSHKDDRWKG